MHPNESKCKPGRAVATIRPAANSNNPEPLRLLEGETTPRVTRLLGELLSVAAMNTADRMAAMHLKQAAAEAFNAWSVLERAQARRVTA